MTLFGTLFWLDAVALGIGVLLLMWGITDTMPVLGGTLAATVLTGTAAALIGALRLRAAGRPRVALWLLLLPAIPAVVGVLSLVTVIILFATSPGGHH